jgi:Clp amino terminal domain, pathogenicity island component
MTRGKRTTALALAGAVALASGAYALGSQAGDGAAAAAKTTNGTGYGPPPRAAGGQWRGGPSPGDRGPGVRLTGLADRLGVSEADLRKALTDLGNEKRDDIAQKLADALGIDVAKVQSAFDKLRPKGDARPNERHDEFAQTLAKQLNLPVAKVRTALENQRDHRGDPAALAGALGVSTAKLRQALATVFKDHRPGPRGGPGGPGRPGFGPGEDALAKTLGVTPAKLRAAFEKLRAEKTDAFAAALAKKLNIDPAKVKGAVDDAAPFGFGHRHP